MSRKLILGVLLGWLLLGTLLPPRTLLAKLQQR